MRILEKEAVAGFTGFGGGRDVGRGGAVTSLLRKCVAVCRATQLDGSAALSMAPAAALGGAAWVLSCGNGGRNGNGRGFYRFRK